ncbi:MAG: hypothetical protein LBS83_00295 [Holosporales bacterium]|nr:hypothetical protein [Holosporales bacterium]
MLPILETQEVESAIFWGLGITQFMLWLHGSLGELILPMPMYVHCAPILRLGFH